MDAKQKRIAIIVGAAVALYLVYRWYSGQTSSSTTAAGVQSPDTASSDFASLAGQEQSDVAALQGQNSQLLGQEQGDVAGLQGAISGFGAQEQSDVSGLTGAISGISTAIDGLTGTDNTLGQEVAALATGQQQINRQMTAQIQTHPGGAFYKYYVNVTGHKPPAAVQVNNFVYQAWKSGVKATALQKNPPHPSAPKNTHIAHPNPTHIQTSHWKPAAPPPKTVAKQVSKPKAPPKSSKPKVSGRRK